MMHCVKEKGPRFSYKPPHNALNLAFSLPKIPHFEDHKYTILGVLFHLLLMFTADFILKRKAFFHCLVACAVLFLGQKRLTDRLMSKPNFKRDAASRVEKVQLQERFTLLYLLQDSI